MRRWLLVLPSLCLLLSGCPEDLPRKPDPTKGTVTGSVVCTDTGKPARFAEVQLLPAAMFNSSVQMKHSDVDLGEAADTGLDGRFKIEAVPPGDYYAFATLNGYLDPERGIDFSRAAEKDDDAQMADALSQWKEHFVEVSVSAQHTTELSLAIERGAEIDGTVSYDDSSPAIGVRFELLREAANGKWTPVGESKSDWALEEKTDSHGRYRITNLPAGEYKVCAMLPVKSEERAPHICLGNTFRKKNAQAVKVGAGEIAGGVDIAIPLTGLYTVAGNVAVGVDGHAPAQATVHLLYADDRAEERRTAIRSDGSFEFEYVPADNYILQVTDAQDGDAGGAAQGTTGGGQQAQSAPEIHRYLDKEIALSVQGEMNDVNLPLVEAPPRPPAGP